MESTDARVRGWVGAVEWQLGGGSTRSVEDRRNRGPAPERRMNMLALLKKLVREESAQDLAEYGIALAVIAAGAAAIAVAIGSDVETLWSNAQSVIADATTP